MTSQIDLSKFVDKKVRLNFRQNKRNPHEGYIKFNPSADVSGQHPYQFTAHMDGIISPYEPGRYSYTKQGEIRKGLRSLGDIVQVEEID